MMRSTQWSASVAIDSHMAQVRHFTSVHFYILILSFLTLRMIDSSLGSMVGNRPEPDMYPVFRWTQSFLSLLRY
jgi:hypothetical protein